MNKIYVVFDLECTCWKGKKQPHEIIEIGAVRMHYDGKLYKWDEYQTFVKPIESDKLSNFCKNLTSIKQEEVDNARTLEQVLPEFLSYSTFKYTHLPTFVSWGNFDRLQFLREGKRKKLNTNLIVDNHISAKHAYEKISGKQLGMKSMLKHLKMDFEGTPHRGIDDAINLAYIFEKIFDKIIKV